MARSRSKGWASLKALISTTLSILLLGLAVSSCVLLLLWLKDPGNFPITDVKVRASYQHISHQEIQQTILPLINNGFFGMPISNLKNKLDSLEWADTVSVERIWPNTVAIVLTEQHASARWGKNGVLNNEGLVFYPKEETIPINLPVINGPSDQNQSIFQHYQELQALLNKSRLMISEVQVSPRRSWTLVLANHVTVALGRCEHETRIRRLMKVWPTLQKKVKTPIKRVDLRYPNGLAVS